MRNVNTEVLIGWPAKEKSYNVTVWIQRFSLNLVFSSFFFFPFFYVFQGGRRQNLLFTRQMSLFTHCFGTVYALFMEPTATLLKKYIKNRSHGTIHTFKNYFAKILSVFSFLFQQQ